MLDDQYLPPSKRYANLIMVVLLIALMGIIIGGFTNLISSILSEEYFKRIMGWNFEGIWVAAVFQGIFEGLIYGIIYGIIYSIGLTIITKSKVTWSYIKPQLIKFLSIIFICWIIGGLIGIVLVLAFPESHHKIFTTNLPNGINEKLKFSWVAGSIWGNITGGGIALLAGLFNAFKKPHPDWRGVPK